VVCSWRRLVDDLVAGREQFWGVIIGPGLGVLDLDHAEAAKLALGAVEVAVAVAIPLDKGVAGDVVADLDAVDDVGREWQPRLPRPAGGAVLEVVLRRGGATTADGRDRKQLERICRYLLRPPFAHDAVTALPGGRVRVSFKAPWRSGTAHADMDAHQFLARLCALVPPPGFHMTRYYGVFASHHRLREGVIPRPAAPPPPPQLALDFALADDSPASSPRPRRIAWAKLLARVFALDITRCRKCGGRMRVLEVVSDADAIARILHGARASPAPPPTGQLLLLP